MGSGVAAEQDGTPAASLGVFGRWTEGVSPNVVISLVGSVLVIRVGGSLGGILRMLDFQFEIPQGWLDVLDRELDESLGELATQDAVRRC